MDRNLVRRVEVVFPIEQADLKARVIDEILALSLADNAKARELLSDGTYKRLSPASGKSAVRSQQRFLELASESERRQALVPGTEPLPATGANGASLPKVVKRTSKPRRGS